MAVRKAGPRNLVWWVCSYTVLGETWYLVDRSPYYAQIKLRAAYDTWNDQWPPLPLWRVHGIRRRDIYCLHLEGPFLHRREADDACLAYTIAKIIGDTRGPQTEMG